MTAMGDRLKSARAEAGYESARNAAVRNRWKVSTYAAHENGQNEFGPEAAERYGRAFKVDPGWLLTGRRQIIDGVSEFDADRFSKTLVQVFQFVRLPNAEEWVALVLGALRSPQFSPDDPNAWERWLARQHPAIRAAFEARLEKEPHRLP